MLAACARGRQAPSQHIGVYLAADVTVAAGHWFPTATTICGSHRITLNRRAVDDMLLLCAPVLQDLGRNKAGPSSRGWPRRDRTSVALAVVATTLWVIYHPPIRRLAAGRRARE
jgi:hypothetical protein